MRSARPSQLVLAAMFGAVTVIVAVFLFVRFVAPRPSGDRSVTAPSGATTIDSRRFAVLLFENLTRQASDDWLAGALSDAPTLGLQSVQDVTLVNRERIIELSNRQALKEAGAIDPQLVRKLSQLLRVRYYVHGSYQNVGDRIKVVARLVDVESGAIRAQGSVTDDASHVLQIEDALARKFANALDAGVSGGPTRRAISRAADSPRRAHQSLGPRGSSLMKDRATRCRRAGGVPTTDATNWA